MYPLNTPIENLTRVGKTTASRLKKLGINNVLDLLYYFPFRYDDFSQLGKIKDLQPNQTITVKGKIVLINNRRAWKKRMTITEALIEDDTGTIKVIWFNQPFLIKNLKANDEVYISGKVFFDKLGLQFISPVYEKASQRETLSTAKIVPVYPLTNNLTLKQLRFLISLSLDSANLINEWLPEELINKYQLLSLPQALKEVHFPAAFDILEQARKRLKFDELFLIQMQSQLNRKYLEKNQAPNIKFQEQPVKNFVNSLSFTLTADQKKAAWQILQDMEKSQPANRLLEGDVGSGKTVVAAIAILNAVLSDFQAVLMAPTEILAKQHFYTLNKLLGPLGFKVAIMTRSDKLSSDSDQKNLTKEEIISSLKNGKIKVVVGTHALLADEVYFQNLGLVIVDEQHRFGVEQRKRLKQKNLSQFCPHFLSMTATPIPRSLALIIYGDLDLSIIRQMPKGRKKIITKLVDEQNRHQAYQFIREEINAGRQVFVICPLIDPSDKLGYKSVKEEYKKLDKEVFPEIATGLLHGKLKPAEKQKIMADFKDNKVKILVSTSVIEVGIDVPNATIMMIEGADRFGLAQLHQFRGRVGRGQDQAYCFLLTENQDQKTKERLNALVNSNDGFALAEYDLKFRGPGEVYGTRQSGLPDLKIATLNDLDLIKETKEEAEAFLAEKNIADYPALAQRLKNVKIVGHSE